MTWNVSNSGTKEEVKAAVTKKVVDFHQHPRVAEALCLLIDEQAGPKVSISGSGSFTSCSLSLSSFT